MCRSGKAGIRDQAKKGMSVDADISLSAATADPRARSEPPAVCHNGRAPVNRLRRLPLGMGVATLLLPLLAGCSSASILHPAGPVGAQNRLIMFDALGIMLAIVIPTMLATIAFAWWFRAGNPRARYRPEFVYSGRIELIVWSIPILTILFLGGVIWIGSHQLDPAKPLPSNGPPLQVQVVALDWKWLFIYPEQGVASVNDLVLPVGRPVRFSLTSASVMTAFFVPRLGSQIYAMNGMATTLHLQADQPGDYFGTASHFSGDGFSDMQFIAHAVPPGQFAAWAARARSQGPALDANAYRSLSQQSKAVRPYTYRAVDPRLFDAVVRQILPPAPGPDVGRGGPQVSPGDRR
jgi:cytochrome o ubiquinol oxidase subunit 2